MTAGLSHFARHISRLFGLDFDFTRAAETGALVIGGVFARWRNTGATYSSEEESGDNGSLSEEEKEELLDSGDDTA